MADANNLFGDSDEDSEQEQEQEQQPEAAPAAATDKKAKLLELARNKRKAQEEAAAEAQREKQAKKQKKRGSKPASGIDFGDSDEDDEDYDAGADEEEGTKGEALELEPEEDEEEKERLMVATDADRAFIDDTELAPDERIDFGDDDEQEAVIQAAEEAAESDDELDRLFNKKRRGTEGGGRSDYENKMAVENFLAQMEVAVEEDQKDYEAGRPAVHKLRMLQRVEEMLTTKRLHGELLDGGLLGVLKAWLEPLPDGTLPNSKVRGTVLRLLGQLPVDCAQEDRKEQLKRSGLGRVVMFLYKVPDETAANRRMAKELIERWSRPILAPRAGAGIDSEEQQRILEARQARQQRLAEQVAAAAAEAGGAGGEHDDPDAPRGVAKPGDRGFRWHAAVPQAASLDYVRPPASQYAMPEKKQGGGKDKGQHKLNKKLQDLKKKGGRMGRAANVSVEGRNVTLQH